MGIKVTYKDNENKKEEFPFFGVGTETGSIYFVIRETTDSEYTTIIIKQGNRGFPSAIGTFSKYTPKRLIKRFTGTLENE